jgi:hypothetical protein
MTTAAAPKGSSLFEDIIEIFASPAKVFARRKGRSFWLALLIYAVITAVLVVGTRPLMQPVFDTLWPQTVAQIQSKNPNITPEQLAAIRHSQPIIFMVSIIVISPISVLVVGLMLWIVGKLFDAEQTLGNSMMVATFASFPRLLAWVAGAIILLVMDPASITSQWSATPSLAHFVNGAQQPILAALLARVEIFTIWTTVLLAIGLSVTGNISRKKAAYAAIIVWIVGSLPSIYQALQTPKP